MRKLAGHYYQFDKHDEEISRIKPNPRRARVIFARAARLE
jgi:hypothetical protein